MPAAPRFCFACGASLPAGARFCPQCGQSLSAAGDEPVGSALEGAARAPAARAEPARARTGEAGTRGALATGGERRQVAVLFADLTGYTRLTAGLDPEDVHRLLGRYFELIDAIVTEYGGRIDKHIGDAVMAVFGAPVAHGDDAERAVRAACDIHRAMERLSVESGRALSAHIGIAAGEVVAAGTGSAEHTEYTVTGDAVNLASRLDALASGGETFVSNALWQAVARRFEAEPAGELAVKGLDQPVAVWRIKGLRSGHDDGLPLVGRRNEFRQFVAALESVADSGTGRLVLLRGDAGIGKTRLAEEFRRLAERAGFACHTGLVLDFGVARGRGAVAAIVADLLASEGASDEAAREAALARALASGGVGADDEAFLRDLLDLPQSESLRATYEAMDVGSRSRGRLQALRTLVASAARAQPRLLVIEDVHWADALTLDCLAALARESAASRTIVLVTSRIAGDPLDARWRASVGPVPLLTLDLNPLGIDESLHLAHHFDSASEQLVRHCVERAEGNPLFLVQLLRGARESASVPASIQSLVLSRIDRLPSLDKAAIQAAAVIGQRFPLALLRVLVGEPGYGCERLIDHHLVRPEGDEFLFAHALISDGAYASLLNSHKRELHRQAAQWYATRDVQLHAQHLDRAADPAAAAACLAAARELAAALRADAALALAQRSKELARTAGERHAAVMLCGEILRDSGRTREAIDAHRQAVELAPDEAARCRALIGVAAGLRLSGEPELALTALAEAGPIADALELTLERSLIHHTRGNLHFARGEVDACLAEHEAALAAARSAGDPAAEANALSGLGDARYAQGRMRIAFERFHDCVTLARAHGLMRIAAPNLCMMGHSRAFMNEFAEALADMEEGTELARRLRQPHQEMFALESLTVLNCHRGAYEEAARVLAPALEMARAMGSRRYESVLLYYDSILALQRGDRAGAIARIGEALAIVEATGIGGFIAAPIYATLSQALAPPTERRRALEEGETWLARGSLGHCHLWYRTIATDSAIDLRDWPLALHQCEALAEYTRGEPLAWADFHIARGRTLVAWWQGNRGAEVAGALRRLRDEAVRCGIGRALHSIDAALLLYTDAAGL